MHVVTLLTFILLTVICIFLSLFVLTVYIIAHARPLLAPQLTPCPRCGAPSPPGEHCDECTLELLDPDPMVSRTHEAAMRERHPETPF